VGQPGVATVSMSPGTCRAPHVLDEYQFLAIEHWDNAVLGTKGTDATPQFGTWAMAKWPSPGMTGLPSTEMQQCGQQGCQREPAG
jgi:hypothetical protein